MTATVRWSVPPPEFVTPKEVFPASAGTSLLAGVTVTFGSGITIRLIGTAVVPFPLVVSTPGVQPEGRS
jgi:hypothetical protein